MSHETKVVLVGVGDYPLIKGRASKLPGSVGNNRLWEGYCRKSLKMRDITALGPRVTTAEVRSAFRGLIEWLRANTERSGLFVFSGHGVLAGSNREPALCCSDTNNQAGLKGYLPLKSLRTLVTESVRGRLVIVLDSCHLAALNLVDDTGDGIVVGLEPEGASAAPPSDEFEISGRVLLAAKEGQAAYQATFLDGQYYGAFTYTLLSAAARWGASGRSGRMNRPVKAHPMAHASYEQAQDMANKLLEAFAIGQKSVALGSNAWQKGPFLSTLSWRTLKKPDKKKRKAQLDPTVIPGYRLYTWLDSNDQVLAKTLVPTTQYEPYVQGFEYWRLGTASVALANVLPGKPTKVKWQDYFDWSEGDPLANLAGPVFSNEVEPEMENLGGTVYPPPGERFDQVGDRAAWILWTLHLIPDPTNQGAYLVAGDLQWAIVPEAGPHFQESADNPPTERNWGLNPQEHPDTALPGPPDPPNIYWGYYTKP